MPKELTPKRQLVIDYFLAHSDKNIKECAEAVGVSYATASKAFRDAGFKPSKTYPTSQKYKVGTYIGPDSNIYFVARIPHTSNGIFICPFDRKVFVSDISGVGDGRVKSCGCLHSKASRENTFKDITGLRSGKLVAQYCLSETTDDNRAIWHCQCDCGGEKDVIGKSLRQGHTQSCGCLNSKGEALLKRVFDVNQIAYEAQKTFDDLKNNNNNPYRFDFYLSNFNMCIEYDGIQHYKAVGYTDQEQLERNQENDSIKNAYCIKQKIFIVRFPYFEYDNLNAENIIDFIEEVYSNGDFSTVHTYCSS